MTDDCFTPQFSCSPEEGMDDGDMDTGAGINENKEEAFKFINSDKTHPSVLLNKFN